MVLEENVRVIGSHLCEIANIAISSLSVRLSLGEPRVPVTYTGRSFVTAVGQAVAVLLGLLLVRLCLLYTSPSPRDLVISRMPSSA